MVMSDRNSQMYLKSAIGVVLIGTFLFPIYWMLNVSLQEGANAVDTPWLPMRPNLDGYATALRDQWPHLIVSVVIALGAVVLSLVLATPAAYALAQLRIRGGAVFLFAILLSQMIPGIVVANALYSAYVKLHLLNSIPGLILADATAGVPFSIIILRAFMQAIPSSVIEAAWVDGAGHLRSFVSVVLPMSKNALITAGLFSFLFAWGDFLFAVTLTTKPDVRPITMSLYTYVGSYVNDWAPIMATGIIASIPAVLLLVFAQRYIAAGATAGAVK